MRIGIEIAIQMPETWRKHSGRLLWEPCRSTLRRFENFISDIKCIDTPFTRDGAILRGPSWAIQILVVRDAMEIDLKEGNPEVLLERASELWDVCYGTLYRADKCVQEAAGSLYTLSNSLLHGIK